jgi:hypothetical protein
LRKIGCERIDVLTEAAGWGATRGATRDDRVCDREGTERETTQKRLPSKRGRRSAPPSLIVIGVQLDLAA